MEDIVNFFKYDRHLGELYWKESRSGVAKNSKAGGNYNGYLRVMINRKTFAIHNIIWFIEHGNISEGLEIDHINHIRNDNRIENLRLVSHSDNQKNHSLYKTNKSGYSGVGFDKRNSIKPWYADIGRKKLGTFSTKEEAIAVRKKAEIEFNYHPNHGKK